MIGIEGEKPTKGVVNHFEKDSCCQVFNGPISGCVFAMPGATVNQSPVQRVDTAKTDREEEDVMDEIHSEQETFADRVKSIMRKAATKNGERIKTSVKGHPGTYVYNVDVVAFCKAMDELVSAYGQRLKEFLGGTMYCVQVTKVCQFIGQVVRRQIINDAQLQLADMLFAFEDYYNLSTVKSKLSIKRCSNDQKVLLGTFEGLLRGYKT